VRIIGVIDLKDGQAVHARGGRRDEYAAVSKAAGTVIDGDAVKLAGVYLDTFGLADIYVADLDAIGSAATNDEVVRRVCELGGNVLVDGGVAGLDDAHRVAAAGADQVIVGLETLPSFDILRDVCHHYAVTFSLDLRGGVPMCIAALANLSPEDLALEAVAAGAQAIIVLDVARVGGLDGPDREMLKHIRQVAPDSQVLAGGGVRSLRDLKQLADIGCDGALVASALHDGRLTASDVSLATAFRWPE
jgi:phosphoribosylformimino-5-aminoimidazole carboxamide ribotide isomerase